MRRKSLVERIPLALFSAVLMGGAVAFFFFAMPMVLIEQGVIASGLPTLISAAGPPLGATARTLVAGAFALLTGGTTWLAITFVGMIGRPGVRSAREADEAQPTVAPSLDVLSAAPARRPIFATSELGAPIGKESEIAAVVEQPLLVDRWSTGETEPLDVPFDDVLDLVDVLPEELPAPPLTPVEQLPIAVLMDRLEAGAERRAAKAAAAATVAPAPAPVRETANGFDGALRSALEELQRMAAR